MEHPWLFERCRDVQRGPDGHIDLWAREHYKSTIITFGLTLQDILASHGEEALHDIEMTFGIFSHNRPTAVKFLSQIKQELEHNPMLRELFPDIIWENPGRDAPRWSVYSGCIVKRKRNAKEATLEAWGLIDGMPTGSHYDVMVYDDIVTKDVVRNPEMIEKVTESLELSYNLGARGGVRRMIGTRYHFADSYKTVMDRGSFSPRVHPATDTGNIEGEPVFLSEEELAFKRRDMGPYTFACQMMQNPKADETQGFMPAWLRYYDGVNKDMLNRYILVDPANEKKKRSDYTSLWVVGIGEDDNFYALDIVRDRLNLTQRARLLMDKHRKWRPLGVGYEKYGMQADIDHIRDLMEREGYRFEITELGGQLGNTDRVRRLIPLFEQSRIWLPRKLHYTDYEGTVRDMVHVFVEEEYKPFPVGLHPDMLDSLSRICDEDFRIVSPRKKRHKPELPRIAVI